MGVRRTPGETYSPVMATTTPSLAPIAERAAAPETLPAITAGGLTWRPATADDVPALLELRNTIAAADKEPYRESLEEITELFAAPWRRFDVDSIVGLDDDGRMLAYAMVESQPGDTRTMRAFLFGGVHPTVRWQGIGRELFAWQVARGRQVLAESGKDLPARLGVFVEDDGPAAKRRIIEAAGFAPRRYYTELRRDLRDLAAQPLPDVRPAGGLRVVPFSDELDEATRLAHNDAFRDHWGSEPQTPEQWRTGRTAFMPQWSFVVVDDAPDVTALLADPDTDAETAAALEAGEPLVVAYEMASKFTEDFAVKGYTFGYTELLGTRRAYRGRRAGLAALAAGMRAFVNDEMEYAALDVDTANPSGAHGMYASLGYEVTTSSTMLSIEL
ncbi:GNAT family N-acetyltransferase [Isoptericola chiayiensis]|uniref:GNAT family N-acetyltransferase n=2 Tax=Isoptericola chiayiensis TaxID=579446 RepID=A0ABP8YK69_9MICO